VKAGEVKFVYPTVPNGPSLFSLTVYQFEQGILQEYHAYILIVGSSPNWTGVDRPHFFKQGFGYDVCMPFLADLMEVSDGQRLEVVKSECVQWEPQAKQVCSFAFDRESNDMTYSCLKNGKEVRFP
jgi:hypothetical protein